MKFERKLICLDYRQSPSVNEKLLWLLKLILESDPKIVPRIATSYYEFLRSLLVRTNLAKEHRILLLAVINAPLVVHGELEHGCKCIPSFILFFWRDRVPRETLVENF